MKIGGLEEKREKRRAEKQIEVGGWGRKLGSILE